MLGYLFTKVKEFVTGPGVSQQILSYEFNESEFSDLVFSKSRLLTPEAVDKLESALAYCGKLSPTARVTAFKIFDTRIIEKRDKLVETVFSKESDLKVIIRRKLQFSCRFLPFLTILTSSTSSEVYECERILLDYLSECVETPNETIEVVEPFSTEFSPTIKVAVISALETVLFPNRSGNFHWKSTPEGKNFHNFSLFLFYLTVVKVWKITRPDWVPRDPFRHFFNTNRSGVILSIEYSQIEVVNIFRTLLRTVTEFRYLTEDSDTKTNFQLGLDLVKAWSGGDQRTSVYSLSHEAKFLQVLRPILKEVLVSVIDSFSAKETNEIIMLLPACFIKPPAIRTAIMNILNLGSDIISDSGTVNLGKITFFTNSLTASIVQFIFSGDLWKDQLFQLLNENHDCDPRVMNSFLSKIAEYLMTTNLNDVPLELLLKIPKEEILSKAESKAEGLKSVHNIVISSACHAARKQIGESSSKNLQLLHFALNTYFLHTAKSTRSIKEGAQVFSHVIIEILRVVSVDNSRNKTNFQKFLWCFLAELSQVEITEISQDVIDEIGDQIKHYFTDQNQNRLIARFRMFQDDYSQLLKCSDYNKSLDMQSSLYQAVAAALGKLIFEAMCNQATSTNFVVSEVHKVVLSHLRANRDTISWIGVLFIVRGVDFVSQKLSENRLQPPKNLPTLAKSLNHLMEHLLELNRAAETDHIVKAREKFINYATQLNTDIDAGNFKKTELLSLNTKSRSFDLETVAEMISIFSYTDKKVSNTLLEKIGRVLSLMTLEEKRHEELVNVIDFLDSCRLLVGTDQGGLESKAILTQRFRLTINRADLSLRDLQTENQRLEDHLNLSEYVLKAMRKFAKQSNLFMKAFRNGIDQSKKTNTTKDIRFHIETATTSSILSLNNLVLNEDSRMNDFQLSEDFLKQFQRDGKNRETELNLIAEFFQTQSEGGGRSLLLANNTDVHQRLTCAFNLNRYLVFFSDLTAALKHLNLQFLAQSVEENAAYRALREKDGNFRIVDAPSLLNNFLATIGQLSLTEVQLVIRVGSSNCALLLEFFRKKDEQFGPTLNNAKQMAVRNPHLMGILVKLETVHFLLEPFWSSTTVPFGSFGQLKAYFHEKHVDENADFLTDIDEVIRYFPDIQDYFFEEATGKSADIVRIATKNLKGQYVSTLSSSPHGATFLMILQSEKFTQEIDQRKLEDHVQWARLAKSAKGDNLEDYILQCFIDGYEFSKELHTIRLLLESLGHPDYQADAEQKLHPRPQLDGLSIEDQVKVVRLIVDGIKIKTHQLRKELHDWETASSEVFRECPRLRLLKFRSRVQLLRILKICISGQIQQAEDKVELLLPFVIQCIPELSSQRQTQIDALLASVNDANVFGSQSSAIAILQTAKRLLSQLLNIVELDSPTKTVFSPCRLVSKSFHELYFLYLRLIIDQSSQSSMTLWGENETSLLEILDAIAIASSGVCSCFYFFGVDKLSPLAREELLRGMQSVRLTCQVFLLFGSDNGTDAFQQYEIRDPPIGTDHSQYRTLLWNQEKVDMFVIGGAIGAGKTTFIQQQNVTKATTIKIWVHEGFSVSRIINELKAASKQSNQIIFHIDVTEYGQKLDCFGRFLHHLLIYGLLVDEENGNSYAFLPSQQLDVYLELPATKENEVIWPLPNDTFHPKDHKYLHHLPVVRAMLSMENYILIKQNFPFIIDHDCILLYRVLSLLRQFDNAVSPEHFSALINEYILRIVVAQDTQINHEQCRSFIYHFLQENIIEGPKKVQRNFVKTLASRLTYFLRMMKLILDERKERMESPLHRRLKVRGNVKKLLQLLLLESKILSSDSPRLPANVPFTLRPETWEGGFEVILISSDQSSVEYQNIIRLFPEIKVVALNAKIESRTCSEIAPAFGITNEGEINRLLERHSHVMTAESALRLLHVNSKRELGWSVINEGDTGCGKTKNLDLLSVLLNASSKYYFNIRLHVVACLKGFTATHESSLPVNWKRLLPSLNTSLPAADFKSRLVALIFTLSDVLMIELCCTIYLYFQLLFTNSLYQQAAFLAKYGDPVKSYIQGHAEEVQRIVATLSTASRQPIIIAEVCTIGGDILNSINSIDVTDAEEDRFSLFSENDRVDEFLNDLLLVTPKKLFYRKLADESLTPQTLRSYISDIKREATAIQNMCTSATIVVFIDELNTSGCLGMVSELFLSHSIDGEKLNDNIYFVGAINPYIAGTAQDKARTADFLRIRHKEDENIDYLAYAPYIVKPLTPNMSSLLASFDNLTSEGEIRFLKEYFQLHISISCPTGISPELWKVAFQDFCNKAINTIVTAQASVRSYRLPRVYMSIRNLIRAVEILKALVDDRFFLPTARKRMADTLNSGTDYEHIFLPKKGNVIHNLVYHLQVLENALVMTIAVGYMFQLPSEGHARLNSNLIDYRAQLLNSLSEFIRPEEFKQTLMASLIHLISYAKIPKGLAKTNALMENFYSIILTAMLRIPLLITGPPGCGKTLAYMLVCDCLQGESDVSVAFQHLKKVQKKTYQCSAWTTAAGINSFLEDCISIQKVLRDTLVFAGFDEAGLVPENRQALKTMHDILDQRLFGIVMMSNTTLDAAKTSRTIQLLQTQATHEDLDALAWGILIPDDDSHADLFPRWRKVIQGFCKAYYTLDDVVKDHWFHSRDFVFGCRMLRKFIDSGVIVDTLFSSEQLLNMLRRHFQPLDPANFPKIADHFLKHCGFPKPGQDDLSARILQSLRDSFQDRPVDPFDPTGAHCRYILIVDPTDSEASVDILKGLQLFDSAVPGLTRDGSTATCYQSISDFALDKEVRRQADVLGEISIAVEAGKTLLLSNSGPIQSSLYDLINRYYQILTTSGSKAAFTNIALGSFSRQVRVNPEFRLVIIVKKFEILGTPLPFLNRFEKYTLSTKDVFQQRLSEIIQNPTRILKDNFFPPTRIKEFFKICQSEVESFYDFLGRENAFYGTSDNETVSALLLQYLEDMISTGNVFPSRNLKVSNHFVSLRQKASQLKFPPPIIENDGLTGAIESKSFIEDEDPIVEELREVPDEDDFNIHWNSEDKPLNRIRDIIQVLNFNLLSLAKVQTMFRNRNKLPRIYLEEYLDRQNHFDVVSLIQSYVLYCRKKPVHPDKMVIYTRTDANLIHLSGTQDTQVVSDIIFEGVDENERIKSISIVHSIDSAEASRQTQNQLIIFQLSTFQTGSDCEHALSHCFQALDPTIPTLIVVFANMKQTTANQVTFVRHLVDHNIEELKHTGFLIPTVLFLLHIGADQLILKSCYQTLPLNKWHALYVDAFTDRSIDTASFSLQEGVRWMRIAFKLKISDYDFLNQFDVNTVTDCFHREIMKDIHFFPFSVIPANMRGDPRTLQSYRRQNHLTDEELENLGVIKSRNIYCRGNLSDIEGLFNEFKKREYLLSALYESFGKVWSKLLESTVEEACQKLEQGMTTRGLISEIKRSYSWLLSDFLRTIIYRDLARDWSLEAILSLPTGNNDLLETSSTVRLTTLVLKCVIGMHSHFPPQIGKKTLECKKQLPASKLPLYGSVVKIIDFIIIQAKHLLTKSTGVAIKKDLKIEQLLVVIRHILEKFPEIQALIRVIETDQELFQLFVKDFIRITLEFSNHNHEEVELLTLLARNRLVLDVNTQSASAEKSLFKWFLLQNDIQSDLVKASELINIMKGTNFQSMNVIAALTGAEESIDIGAHTVLYNALLESLTDELNLVNSPTDANRWSKRVRDLIARKIFIPAILTDVDFATKLIYHVLLFKVVSKNNLGLLTSLALPTEAFNDDVVPFVLQFLSNVYRLRSPQTAELVVTFREIVEDSFHWISQCPIVLSSPLFSVIMHGILHVVAPALPLPNEILFDEIFSNLSFSFKCELLRQYLSADSMFAHQIELIIDQLCYPCLNNNESSNYIPSFLEMANSDFFTTAIFPMKPAQCPLNPSFIAFQDLNTEYLLYRTFHLMKLFSSSSLRQACGNFLLTVDQLNRHTGAVSITKYIKLVISIIDLIEKFTERVITCGVRDYMEEFSPDELRTVRQALAYGPRTWAIYLLTRFTETTHLVSLLHHRRVLTALGMEWWAKDPSAALTQNVREQDAERVQIEQTYFPKLLLGLRHSQSLINYYLHIVQINDVPCVDLIKNFAVNVVTDQRVKDIVNCCRALIDEDLAYVKYLPIVVSMHKFMKEKFDYLFQNDEEVRTTLVTDALKRLPLHDELSGRELFRKFLAAWEILRIVFREFRLCPNELRNENIAANQTAHQIDPRAEIPTLTPENTWVSLLVELGTSEHESLTARMIEKVLVHKVNEIVDSSCLESVSNLIDVNPLNLLYERRSHSSKLSYLTTSTPPSYLCTGLYGNSRQQRSTENFISSQISWEVIGPPPEIPDIRCLQSTQTNIVEFLQRERDRLAAEAQIECAIVNEQTPANGRKFVICPNCHIIFEKVDRCASVICAWSYHPEHRTGARNPGCGHAFNQANNLVQRPNPPTVPILQHFYDLRPPASLPSHLLEVPISAVPVIPPPNVQIHINWKAIVRELIITELHGKFYFDLSKDDFFLSLQFFSPLTLAQSTTALSDSESTLTSSTLTSSRERQLRLNIANNLSSMTSYNVFVRLLMVADHIQAEFFDSELITKDSEELLKLPHSSIESYFMNKTEVVLSEIGLQFYSFCEFFFRKFHDYLIEYELKEQIQPENSHGTSGTTEAFLISFYLKEYEQLGSMYLSDANSSDGLVRFTTDFRLYIKQLPFYQIPAIARIIAEHGIVGNSNSSRDMDISFHSSNSNVSFSRVDATNLQSLRDQLIAKATNQDITGDIAELKLLGLELQKYSEEFLLNPDNLLFHEYLRDNHNTFSITCAQASQESLIKLIISENLQLKHYPLLIKFIRRLIGELEYHSLKLLQSQWITRQMDQLQSEGGSGTLGNVIDRYYEKLPKEWEKKQLPSIFGSQENAFQLQAEEESTIVSQLEIDFANTFTSEDESNDYEDYDEDDDDESSYDSWYQSSTVSERYRTYCRARANISFVTIPEETDNSAEELQSLLRRVIDPPQPTILEEGEEEDEILAQPSSLPAPALLPVNVPDVQRINLPLPPDSKNESSTSVPLEVALNVLEQTQLPPRPPPHEEPKASKNTKLWYFMNSLCENDRIYCWICNDITSCNATLPTPPPIDSFPHLSHDPSTRLVNCGQCLHWSCLDCFHSVLKDCQESMSELGVIDEESLNYLQEEDLLELSQSLPSIVKGRFMQVGEIPTIPSSIRTIQKKELWKRAREFIVPVLRYRACSTVEERKAIKALIEKDKEEECYEFIVREGLILPEDICYLNETEFDRFCSFFKKIQMRQIKDCFTN